MDNTRGVDDVGHARQQTSGTRGTADAQSDSCLVSAEESGLHEQKQGLVPFVVRGRPSMYVEVGYGGAVGEEVAEGD
eukprot:3053218-Rhodomonas_salina.2